MGSFFSGFQYIKQNFLQYRNYYLSIFTFYCYPFCVYFDSHQVKWINQSNVIDIASIQTFNFTFTLIQIVVSLLIFLIHLMILFSFSPLTTLVLSSITSLSSYHLISRCIMCWFSFGSSIREEHPIHNISFRYQHSDWDSFFDFLRDASWSDVFTLPLENFTTVDSSWVKYGFDASVSFRKY